MKNKNLAVWICIVLSLILSAVALILRFIPLNTEKNAIAIYDECLYNVVEVKAVSESVGESYGTAEVINENGTLVTNAHVVTYTRLSIVNADGELVGITTFRTKDTSGNVIYGIVYCIPINTVLEYINN